MEDKEVWENYSEIDKDLRKLAIFALFGLSFGKFAEEFTAKLGELRKKLPHYIDWFALSAGLFGFYGKWFRQFAYIRDVSKTRETKKLEKALIRFGESEPWAETTRKIDARSELDNEIEHHRQKETLKLELNATEDEMSEIFGDWAKEPTFGGTADYEEGGEEAKREADEAKKPKVSDESETPKRKPKKNYGDLFVISIHMDCSNRCLPDQGKIVSKSLPAVSGLWTGKKVDGRKIYSLKAMVARTDKWGWHNFILTGFNCRHHLYPYDGVIPKKPPFDEARERYEEEQKARELERICRRFRNLYISFAKIDAKMAEEYFRKWERARAVYLAYCKEKSIEPRLWRCE